MQAAMEKMNTLNRRALPDVPEDVDYEEIDEHFNDMNWEFNKSKASFDAESVELGTKKSYYGSEADATSIISSRDVQSRVAYHTPDDLEDDSPYPEVRAAVANTDDPSMPVNTFRVWFIGFLVSVIFPALNGFFGLRYPSVYIGSLVIQLATLPLGKLMEKILPTTRFNTFGYIWSFNPGPFNIKEHTVITVIGNITAGGSYATDVILTQKVFYNQDFGFGYQILLVLSTQIFGFSLAGITRRFLVWPASMLWPGSLVNAALFSTMHNNWNVVDKRHMSRNRFFLYVTIGSAVYYFFPGYLFTALSVFNWVCWIAPNNVVVNQLFGYSTGLGFGFLTFDWTMISYIGSPLVTPWWAQANVFAVFVLFIWIVSPIMYYTNVWFSAYLPISANAAFDNTGQMYDPTLVASGGLFNETAFQEYSPLYLPVTYAISYGCTFAGITALISHTWLWYRHDIVRLFRSSIADHKDVHARLMSNYKEVPGWWYATTGVVTFVLAVVTIEAYPTQLPVWALILALLICVVYVIPSGIIQAITNQSIGLNLIAEFIIGYALPGRADAMMLFKNYCFFTAGQANAFTGDLKLGHYMKIPPRVMFWAQMLGSIVCSFVVLGVQNWMVDNIDGLCEQDQKAGFSCPGTNTFFVASLLWGVIGPARLFSIGQLYSPLLWFFLIGFLIPIPFYYAARRYPRSWLRYINFPVFFNGANSIPPASGINYSSWFAVGFVFQYIMRRKHFRWWLRYNYLLSAALDSGVAIGLIIIFFCLQLPKGGFDLNWWGNTVWQNTADSNGVTFLTLAEGQTFGPPPS